MEIKEMEYGKDRKTELLCKGKYKNYNYYVLNLGTHPTAYIEIPKEKKLYGKSYDGIYRMGCDINVNGGLTYSDNELIGISSDNWFIGWDYAHCYDYMGYYEDGDVLAEGTKKWTTKEIIEECKNAIDQIIEFESKEIIEEEKKIPDKLDYIHPDISCSYNESELLLRIEANKDKINEIIAYLKSKGDE